MWTAQDYALIISTLTALLALGVPPVVSSLDARRARRAAVRADMERLLFYVVETTLYSGTKWTGLLGLRVPRRQRLQPPSPRGPGSSSLRSRD